MNNLKTIPLHVHTDMSMLDSILKIDDYIKWAKENEVPAIGVSNHGTISDCLEFYNKCNDAGLKSLLGCEFYLTDNLEEKERDNYHIILYAKNMDGWNNLVKLTTYSNMEENYHYKPRINYDMLEKHSEGLICLSACLGGHVQQLLLNNKNSEARDILLKHIDIFGDDYYIELQEHFLDEQRVVNKQLLNFAIRRNIKTIITTDAHMLDSSYMEAHDVFLCKNTNAKVTDEKRFKFTGEGYYLQTTEQLKERFSWLPDNIFYDCVKNTNEIADKCNVEINYTEYRMPKIDLPEDSDSFKELISLSKIGFMKKFKCLNDNKREIYINRLKDELAIIKELNFQDYMLMLYDVYKYCGENNILTNFSRGSGTASLLLYCLNVTKVDPIKHNLPFSRFINRSRITICDFDMDIEDERRNEVIEYIRNKHGSDKVCNISAFGTLKAKGAIKAVASALDMPFDKSNKLTGTMKDPNLSIQENIEQNKDFAEYYDHEDYKNIIDLAIKIENVKSSISVHPSGVICSDVPLIDICPIIKTKDGYASAFDMAIVEPVLKLVKFDFLGLKTLGVVKGTFNMLKDNGIDLSLETIDYEDDKTFEMLSSGKSGAVFQFESALMSKLLKDVQPKNIDDLSIVNAIARPASLSSGLTTEYIEYRQCKKEPVYLLPEFKNIMASTYGLCIFQEGLISMASIITKLGDEFGDMVRVICAKKKPEKLKKIKEQFEQACISNNISKDIIDRCWEIIESSAGYGFSSCHSVAYSYLSYVTAYLKANYPLEYLTSVLNYVDEANPEKRQEKVSAYMDECYALNIDILPPDINFSEYNFKHDKENYCIRFGFGGLKGIGESAVKNLILERKNGKFTSFIDIIERMPSINKSTLEVLIKSGALNTIETNPYKYLPIIEYFQKAKLKSEYKKGEDTLFNTATKIMALENIEDSELNTVKANLETLKKKVYPKLTDIEDKEIKAVIKQEKIDDKDKIEYLKTRIYELESEYIKSFKLKEITLTSEEIKENEKELLGFSLTYNCKKVLVQLQELIHVEKLADIKEDKDYWNECLVMLEIKSIKKTKTGSYMAVLMDETAEITSFLSRDFYNKYESVLEKGNLFYVNGKLKQSKNPAFEDGFEIINMRQFLINSVDDEIYLTGDISEENLKTLLTNILSDVTINNVDIKYRLSVENNGSLIETNINLWIDDIKRISNYILKYNLRIGKRQ